jgi:hypothetical protein
MSPRPRAAQLRRIPQTTLAKAGQDVLKAKSNFYEGFKGIFLTLECLGFKAEILEISPGSFNQQ